MGYEDQFRNDMEIVKAAKRRCTIYSASYNSHYWYPFKLRSAGLGWDALDKSCMELTIDSNINDDEVTNKDVIEDAIEARANKIIPKDYLEDPERTRQSLIEFEQLIENEYGSIKPNIIPVLQDDHVSHLEKYESFYEEYSHIALGGMKNFEPEEQAKRLKGVREIVGDHTHIHGFGLGCSLGLIKVIRQNPNLLDSLDMATAERMVANGKVTDWSFNQEQPEIPMPMGTNKTAVNAGFSKSVLIMLNYMLTDMVDEEHLEKLFYDELGLGKLEDIIANAEGKSTESMHWSEVSRSPQDLADQADTGQQEIHNF